MYNIFSNYTYPYEKRFPISSKTRRFGFGIFLRIKSATHFEAAFFYCGANCL